MQVWEILQCRFTCVWSMKIIAKDSYDSSYADVTGNHKRDFNSNWSLSLKLDCTLIRGSLDSLLSSLQPSLTEQLRCKVKEPIPREGTELGQTALYVSLKILALIPNYSKNIL